MGERRILVRIDAEQHSCGRCRQVNARSRGARCSVFRASLEWDNDYDGWTRLDACKAAEAHHERAAGGEEGRDG